MKFFNRKKLLIKSEIKENKSIFYIDYYKLNEENDFKISLLKELTGSGLCLVIIDTKFANKKTASETDIFNNIIRLLKNLNIDYKKIEVKIEPSINVLGAAFRMNTAEKKKEYIIGFTIDNNNLINIKEIIESYNTHYYISGENADMDEILSKTYVYHEDEDKMICHFKYNIFDNSNSKNMVIHCMKENSSVVGSILENIGV